MTDDVRDQLVKALAAQHSCDTLLTIPFCNRCKQSADTLLPVVEAIAVQRVADALDDAARWLTGTGNYSDGLAPDVTSEGLSWRDVRTPNEASDWFEQSLRDFAAALRAGASA